MIYLICGTNTEKARTKANALVLNLRTKKPDAVFEKIDEENFNKAKIEEFVLGQGLFVQKNIVFLDRIFENGNTEIEAVLTELLPEMKRSESVFVMLEVELNKKTFTTIEKLAEKVEQHDLSIEKNATASKQKTNVFALGDALGERDKAKLWKLYMSLIGEGSSAEELHGILWWQLKAIFTAKSAKSATEAGLSPFVYTKSKKYSTKFGDSELNKMLDDLVTLPTNSRVKGKGLELALEKWILEL